MTCVALMRLPTTEVAVIRSFMEVVASRGLAYTLADTAEQSSRAELYLVDADNPTAMSLWRRVRHERPGVMGILITRSPVHDNGHIWVQRPLNSMKLLTALGKADMRLNPEGNPHRNRKVAPLTSSLNGARILVIDSSATVRKQLELALNEQGVKVFATDSGEAGLHILSQNNIDLVLLDVLLPGADGYQICKTIKKNRKKNAVPVIMLTSKSSPLDRVKGSLAGCDSYLTKPVEFRRLIEALDKFRLRPSEKPESAGVSIVGSPARAI